MKLIPALRKDTAASAKRDVQARKSADAAMEREAAKKLEAKAEAEVAHLNAQVARLEAQAKAASRPDAQIRAGLLAIKRKLADLFGRR